MGPHNGGCGTCTGLITVQEGGSRAGQVDYTIEYYTTGHLTKFVRPGAYRIDSTANGTVQNVAWRNPDGSKALIAHNGGTGAQSVRVDLGRPVVHVHAAGPYHRDVHLVGHPVRRRRRHRRRRRTGPITGLAGKCVDVAGASTANGTAVQLYTCNGTGAQQWTRGTDGTLRALGKCLDIAGPSTADGTRDPPVGLPRRHLAAVDVHGRPRPDQRVRQQVPRRHRQQLGRRHPAADLDLHRRRQPEVDRTLTITLPR